MSALKLIQIGTNGLPSRSVGDLPQVALDVCAHLARHYAKSGFEPPWVGYLVFEDAQCVGTCCYKSSPVQGRVEIAYFTFPEFEGQGIATRMASALILIARQERPGIVLTAQTLPEKNVSAAILEKLGFRMVGPVEHPEDGTVWEWHLAPDLAS